MNDIPPPAEAMENSETAPEHYSTSDLLLVVAKRFIEEMKKCDATESAFTFKMTHKETKKEYDVRFDISEDNL